MEPFERYSSIIEKILTEYAGIPYAYGEFASVPVFDRTNHRYLLVNVGRDGSRRIHYCLVHVDIIGGRSWIQQDGTEDGIGVELEEAGVPKPISS